MSVVVLSGNPRPGSRTSATALAVARAVVVAGAADGADASIETVELADIAGEVLVGGAGLEAARDTVRAARLLVVATPVYKGAYTGLLKAFLDTYDGGELASVTALAVVVAGQPGHLHAGETHLRPVLLELGAQVPAPTFAIAQGRLGDLDELLPGWVARYGHLLAPAAVPA
ncbi:NAD(P)H-dependent oxidoreductase [Miniimonas arenae]|uniref:NAD(P)H-dependent oxidoreductase n=1 Tax=Miniimonas arenae TaxID=676201 RepID=A0A5C5BCZ9_9MICO|nr:NAD(P)H-dependent oxidoreductase [Miniimonas arenae]TNU76246.1 NAD(P)H-dependent oxidoreductase [Miniimonas arenae]